MWVSETRPRNQGLLTAWELARAGVPTLIADNAAGWLMAEGGWIASSSCRPHRRQQRHRQQGRHLPQGPRRPCPRRARVLFAAPRSTIDFGCPSGAAIPHRERSADEVRIVTGLTDDSDTARIHLAAPDAAACNPAFDVTPPASCGASSASSASSPDSLATAWPASPATDAQASP